MAGGLYGSARTTPRVRAELQASKETRGALAKRYGLSRNTVTKWRARTTIEDAPMGPRSPHSTVLTAVEEDRVPGRGVATALLSRAGCPFRPPRTAG